MGTGFGEALLLAGIATAASTGVALATRPGLPKVTPPLPAPPPPAKAEAPPLAPTETDIGAAAQKKQRDAMRFGLARTVLARGASLGQPGQTALGPGTPNLGG
jgi:hypothetical protein